MPSKAWIEMIEPEDASDPVLQEMYALVETPHGTVDNVMKAHSLRPRTMQGHVVLYRSVLHSPELTLPLWYLEVVASYVSILNNCAYSLFHHFRNAASLIGDAARSQAIRAALDARAPERAFAGKELALLNYAGKLTLAVGAMEAADMLPLRAAGTSDGEILEVNQVVAYFNYSNRLLNGLGVTTKGDRIGYYE